MTTRTGQPQLTQTHQHFGWRRAQNNKCTQDFSPRSRGKYTTWEDLWTEVIMQLSACEARICHLCKNFLILKRLVCQNDIHLALVRWIQGSFHPCLSTEHGKHIRGIYGEISATRSKKLQQRRDHSFSGSFKAAPEVPHRSDLAPARGVTFQEKRNPWNAKTIRVFCSVLLK